MSLDFLIVPVLVTLPCQYSSLSYGTHPCVIYTPRSSSPHKSLPLYFGVLLWRLSYRRPLFKSYKNHLVLTLQYLAWTASQRSVTLCRSWGDNNMNILNSVEQRTLHDRNKFLYTGFIVTPNNPRVEVWRPRGDNIAQKTATLYGLTTLTSLSP